MANKPELKTIKEKSFTISISEDEHGNQNYICLGDNGDQQSVVCESDFTIFMDKLCKCMGKTDFVAQTFDSNEMFDKLLAEHETVDERGSQLIERQRSYIGGSTPDIDTSLDLSALENTFKEIDSTLDEIDLSCDITED